MIVNLYSKFSLFTVFVLIFGTAQAQTLQLKWGQEIDDQKGTALIEVFGNENSDEFYALFRSRKKRDGYQLLKFDTDSMYLQDKKVFQLDDPNGGVPRLLYPISTEKNHFIIASTQDVNEDRITILAYPITSDKTIGKAPIKVATGSLKAIEAGGNFRIFVGDRGQTITAIIPTEPFGGKNEKFEVRLFDSEFQLMRAKNLEVPHSAEDLNYVDALIDSTGDVYVLASIRDLEVHEYGEGRNLAKNFSLLHYSWATESLTEKSLSLGSKWMYDARLMINADKNIQICGYYSNMVDLIIAGTFSVEIQPSTGDVLQTGLWPFDRDFKSNLRPKSKSGREIDAYELNYTFANKKGNVQLLSEKTYTEINQTFNPSMGTYTTVKIYNYDEVLMTSLGKTGQIKYSLVIPKFQSSSSENSSYVSYYAHDHKDRTYVFYNDHFRNADLGLGSEKGYRQLTSESSAQCVMLEILPDGKARKYPLFLSSDKRATFVPNYAYATSNSLILLSRSGYHLQFFKIRLE